MIGIGILYGFYQLLGLNCQKTYSSEQPYIILSVELHYSEPINSFEVCSQKYFYLENCGVLVLVIVILGSTM